MSDKKKIPLSALMELRAIRDYIVKKRLETCKHAIVVTIVKNPVLGDSVFRKCTRKGCKYKTEH